mmetsp:Transcript_17387/g.24325  ORF Transcript_17387/g.24325 Transcript_17387/m.24325 type:complete len:92 (-) Transcript_17387:23-298(-)
MRGQIRCRHPVRLSSGACGVISKLGVNFSECEPRAGRTEPVPGLNTTGGLCDEKQKAVEGRECQQNSVRCVSSSHLSVPHHEGFGGFEKKR